MLLDLNLGQLVCPVIGRCNDEMIKAVWESTPVYKETKLWNRLRLKTQTDHGVTILCIVTPWSDKLCDFVEFSGVKQATGPAQKINPKRSKTDLPQLSLGSRVQGRG